MLAKFEIPNHHFYEALTLLALYPKAENADKAKMMKRVRGNIRKMKKWAKDAPENYQHKLQLMEAEKLRVLGKHSQARVEYDQAIQGASSNRFIHEEALGYEVAGRFYLSNKLEVLAEFYLKAAYNAYREWGAEAKLRYLEQRYPEYVSSVLRTTSNLDITTSIQGTSTTAGRSMLDLSTVLKASTAISSEIVLKSLLRILMRIVIENAGAQIGYLILEKDSELRIQAKYDVDQEDMELLQDIPAESCTDIAISIVQYVNHTKESVVVNDAVNDERYSQDPHITLHQPKSILSLSIINQGKFIGILYLENNLTIGAFTQNRVNLLALLSGQIAVSIDNAMLYENLEQKVEERTEQLNEEKQKSDELLLNILPLETANELKQYGKAVPRRYENVTVMFTDFTDFSHVSEKLSAEELIDEVDTCFGMFDQIMSKHGIEKIKTAGDAYMCAGGIPVANTTHTVDALNAALEIRDWMRQHRKERASKGLPDFNIRIGLHNGPLVAGVVGTRKFAYDIWGETVNIASRMESGSEPGCINVSGTTHTVIEDRFECTYRGKLPVKNMDDIDMYFVEGPRQ